MAEFWVEVSGYLPVVIEAETPAKARYRAYRKFVEGWPCSFRDFIGKSAVWRAATED